MNKTLLILFFFLFTAQMAMADDVKIIVNPDVPETTLSQTQIAELFLGNIAVWPDKTRIQLALNGEEKLHDRFVRKFCRRTPFQFTNHWRNLRYTGKAFIPNTFSTDDEVIKFVSETKGAISYIHGSTTAQNVKIVSVK